MQDFQGIGMSQTLQLLYIYNTAPAQASRKALCK